jgi:colicin import membrane protein
MSTIAKIFTVLNVILAAAFLGWAASAVTTNNEFKENLAKEQAAHNETKKLLGDDKSTLAAKLKESDDARTRLAQQVEDAKAENQRVDNENKGNASKLETIEADYKKIAGTLEGMQADSKAAHEAQVKAQAAQHDAESKAKEATTAQLAADAKASALDGELIAAKEEIAAKEKALASAEKEREKVKTQLDTVVQATHFDLKEVQAMPLIEGSVIAILLGVEPGFVSINRGESAGVKRGFTFELYQGSTYKGQARVEYVQPDTCSAVLVRKVKGETIRQGDGAATRL